ncbi:hypothetical protein T265_04594 [Opisthorchis viverrini]|uniref:Uncharacterized protein n=1 Tax=Opisthorchis viverrini TaxID=6198 RepID=A0A074ZZE8_OPIVI|nr:hypothetical protein T265_04594 [Opisthorchis viverrini]KER28645.1 hypothetical protein T265_04594 [Opisthorchis viverrini]
MYIYLLLLQLLRCCLTITSINLCCLICVGVVHAALCCTLLTSSTCLNCVYIMSLLPQSAWFHACIVGRVSLVPFHFLSLILACLLQCMFSMFGSPLVGISFTLPPELVHTVQRTAQHNSLVCSGLGS